MLQIEQHGAVRQDLGSPQQGDLPLPQNLPQKMVQCKLEKVEDLNVVVPKGAQQLSSQGLNEHVSAARCAIIGRSLRTWEFTYFSVCKNSVCFGNVSLRERLLRGKPWPQMPVQCCCLKGS